MVRRIPPSVEVDATAPDNGGGAPLPVVGNDAREPQTGRTIAPGSSVSPGCCRVILAFGVIGTNITLDHPERRTGYSLAPVGAPSRSNHDLLEPRISPLPARRPDYSLVRSRRVRGGQAIQVSTPVPACGQLLLLYVLERGAGPPPSAVDADRLP